jgi:MoaA/NifB/PqqE/SkfB family radical SAM enzyme
MKSDLWRLPIRASRGTAILMRTAQREGLKSAWEEIAWRYTIAKLPLTVPVLPRTAELELSSRCNLNCMMCRKYLTEFPDAPVGFDMSFKDFQTLLDHCPSIEDMFVRGGGEPLLNSELIPIIREAKGHGVRMHLFTSATLLKEKMCRGLIDVGLHRLVFSVDGATPETYEAIREGARLYKVIDNIKTMVRLKDDLNAEHPMLSLMWIAMRENVDEIADGIRLFGDIGVKNIVVKNLNPLGDETLWKSVITVEQFEGLQDLVPLAEELDVDLTLPPPTRLHYPDRHPNCKRAWEAPLITATGDVGPCPYHRYVMGVKLGNIFEHPMSEIWNSPPYQEFRQAVVNLIRNNSVELCGGWSEA